MSKKNILITGGTGGIGFNISKALAREGHHITIWGRNEDKFNKITNKENLSFEKVDVSDQKKVKEATSKIEKLDILINAAAVLWPVKPFLETDLEKIRQSIDISLWGTIYPCYYLIPTLRESSNGKIINFSGGGGANGRKNHMAYSLSKTAVVRFTENIALENPELDINVIAPGAHKTNMWQDEKSEDQPEKWGDMEELVNFFKFLVGDKSNGIKGKFLNYKDDWNNPEFVKQIKEDPEFLTLRRIDDFQFTKINK